MPRALLIALLLTTATAQAEHAPHVHDHARLTVAVDGADLLIEMEVPAINVFSFERPPRDAAERAGMQHDLAALRLAESWIRPSPEAACKLVAANTDSALLHDPAPGEHADVDVSWQYRCAHPQQLQQVGLDFYDALPGMHSLHVEYLAPGTQGVLEFDTPSGLVPLKP